jgi:hypothetical protein
LDRIRTTLDPNISLQLRVGLDVHVTAHFGVGKCARVNGVSGGTDVLPLVGIRDRRSHQDIARAHERPDHSNALQTVQRAAAWWKTRTTPYNVWLCRTYFLDVRSISVRDGATRQHVRQHRVGLHAALNFIP